MTQVVKVPAISLVSPCFRGLDHIVAESGLPVPGVLSILSVLEMRRLIRRLSGAVVVRT